MGKGKKASIKCAYDCRDKGVGILKERQEQDITENKRAHFAFLTDIANLIDIKISSLVIEKNGAINVTKGQLTAMIENYIDDMCSNIAGQELFDLFITHLEYESKEMQQNFYKFLEDKPFEFMDLVQTLAQGKLFKGTCPECEKW
jgi:hypothetical protein